MRRVSYSAHDGEMMTIQKLIALVVFALFVGSQAGRADVTPGSPKAAAMAFFKAMEDGNTAAAKEAATGNAKQLALLDHMVPMVHAFKNLQTAALKKWGEEGKKLTPQLGPTVDVSSLIQNATEDIRGDKATIVAADPSTMKQPIQLKKVGGAWKVDMAAIKTEEADDPETARMLKGLADLAQSTATEIDQGKYNSPDQAKAAIGRKMSDLLAGKDAPKK